ncbi:MAG: flagellar basal body P-ring formation protein FlgA [Desulfobulbaceae bacterium]|nr:flagellar basal body P-ring formation protein FlgA [Desulfobulbaceae bacterium]
MLIGCFLLLVAAGGRAEALELPVPAAADGVVRVAPELVKGLLEAYLAARADVLPAARIDFKTIEQVRPFTLPAGVATCEIVPADPAIIGSRRFSLIFRVDGRVQANLALRIELEALVPVAVVTGDLPRGAVLAMKDLRLVEKDISTLREPYRDTAELLGKGLLRAMKAGEVIQKGLLTTPPVVHRGELVTLTVRSAGLILTASGSALDNGGLGETIRVRNNSSQKEVQGRITGPGKVEVEM